MGNGCDTSLWFDPWWRGRCLASNNNDYIISQTNMCANATVNNIISTGTWQLPNPNDRHHHVHANLLHWINYFDFPHFDLSKVDRILWAGIKLHKVRTWHIWEEIRFKLPKIHWHGYVWHKLRITRYAHHEWIVCHGRLHTMNRLASFGLDIMQNCFMCIRGQEDLNHLLITCDYSSYVLQRLATLAGTTAQASTWIELLTAWGTSTNPIQQLLLLIAQVYCYQIWRERNARVHCKGCVSPSTLIDGIIRDVKCKLRSSIWFVNVATNSVWSRWLDIN